MPQYWYPLLAAHPSVTSKECIPHWTHRTFMYTSTLIVQTLRTDRPLVRRRLEYIYGRCSPGFGPLLWQSQNPRFLLHSSNWATNCQVWYLCERFLDKGSRTFGIDVGHTLNELLKYLQRLGLCYLLLGDVVRECAFFAKLEKKKKAISVF